MATCLVLPRGLTESQIKPLAYAKGYNIVATLVAYKSLRLRA